MGGNVSEGRGPLPLLPQNCRRGALPALSKGVYPCPQPFPAQSTFCYESHLNAEVFQSLLWEETCTPSRNLHLTTFPQRRRSFGRRSPQSPRLLISRKRTAPRTEPSCGTRHWPRNRSGGPSCTACPMRTVCPVAWPSSGKTRRRSLSKSWLWPRGAGTGDTAGRWWRTPVEEVRRSGGGTICIGAMYENRKLVRWYERQGFSITGTRKFAHLPFVVCFMEKSV